MWRLLSISEERELSPDDKAINSLTVTIVSVSLVAVALVGALIYLLVFIIQRKQWVFHSVFRIHVFFGLPDPDPDPLVRGMDPDPALDPDPGPSIIMQK